jgi:hypothetical protein
MNTELQTPQLIPYCVTSYCDHAQEHLIYMLQLLKVALYALLSKTVLLTSTVCSLTDVHSLMFTHCPLATTAATRCSCIVQTVSLVALCTHFVICLYSYCFYSYCFYSYCFYNYCFYSYMSRSSSLSSQSASLMLRLSTASLSAVRPDKSSKNDGLLHACIHTVLLSVQ